MPEKTFCLNCHKSFKPKRDDAKFCSDRCAAAWARNEGYGRERFHAEKPEWIKKNCAWCDSIFEYNEYAMRGGDRVPQYCSNKCRQAAYRKRKAEAGESAGYTGNWDDARNDKTRTKGTSQNDEWARERYEKWRDERHKGTQQESSGKGTQQDSHKGTQQPPSGKGTSQNKRTGFWWHGKDPYKILDVLRTYDRKQCQKAYRDIVRECHPDVSKHPAANEITQRVNWAWDEIKKQRGWI